MKGRYRFVERKYVNGKLVSEKNDGNMPKDWAERMEARLERQTQQMEERVERMADRAEAMAEKMAERAERLANSFMTWNYEEEGEDEDDDDLEEDEGDNGSEGDFDDILGETAVASEPPRAIVLRKPGLIRRAWYALVRWLW